MHRTATTASRAKTLPTAGNHRSGPAKNRVDYFMLPSLYTVVAEHRALAERLMDMGLEDDVIADTLEAESNIVEKAQSYGFVIRNLEALKMMEEVEATRLSERATRTGNRIDAIKETLRQAMIATGTTKIEHPQFTISLAKNPTSVDVFDERQVPVDYFTDPKPPAPRIDKRLIKQAIESGYDVPGANLKQDVSLRIK